MPTGEGRGANRASTREIEQLSSTPSPWETATQDGGGSRGALRELRRQIDEGAPPGEIITSLVRGLIVDGEQELLATEASVVLQRSPSLAEAAQRGELVSALRSACQASAARPAADGKDPEEIAGEYLMRVVDGEVVGELHTSWDEAVKKWRKKALAVEKYRSPNPTANAAVYTYMVNCCLRQGMWEVAYDALTYAGLMSAGPFFVSRKDLGRGSPAVVLDMDKMACYVAEKILDMDLDVWRRREGSLAAWEDTPGSSKADVGIEESNFAQNEGSATHLAALRVQDMTLGAARVALRKIRASLAESHDDGLPADASVVVLCSSTADALAVRELLVPPRAMETLLALDFAGPVEADAEEGTRLVSDPEAAATLGLSPGGHVPLVILGDELRAWAAQGEEPRIVA